MPLLGSHRRPVRAMLALLCTIAVMATSLTWLTTEAAGAQLATDFNLSVSNGEVLPGDDTTTVTVSIDPGTSDVAAIGAFVDYDAAVLNATSCTSLVGFGACNFVVPGRVTLQTVEAAGWAQPTDLFTITFTNVGLTSNTPLTVTLDEAYNVSSVLIAGDVTNGDVNAATRGDVNCSDTRDIADALIITQYVVGLRSATTKCPLPTIADFIHSSTGDMNSDSVLNIADALIIAQCSVGISTPYC